MSKTITITVDEKGESTVDLNGFHGKGCEAVMKALRGNDTVRRSVTKPEFNQQEVQEKGKLQQ
jgi:hypothetical protein